MDGCIYMCPETGVPPGLYCSPDLFNSIYARVLMHYHVQANRAANMLQVPSLSGQQSVDGHMDSQEYIPT
eukprot:12429233-Karenia_brevis.AAC.1